MSLKSNRSRIRRLPDRGHYDRETLYQILDNNFLCHIAFVMDNHPYVIPMAYGRSGEYVYVHGSSKSRMLRHLASGAAAAVAVTQTDGIVLARSLFHSSINYHSVIIYGHGEEVSAMEEKMEGLRIVTENICPGRWNEARLPNARELKATTVLRILITDGAAKIRTGPAKDVPEDYALPIWAGVLPINMLYGNPVADDQLQPDIHIPASVRKLIG